MSDSEFMQIVIIGFAISIPVGIVAFIFLKQKSRKLKELLESVATKWGGKIVISQLQFYPLLKLFIKGQEVTISFRMERQRGRGSHRIRIPPETIVKTNLIAAPQIELIVLKKTLLSQLVEKLGIGMKDIPLGYPDFDDTFVVKSRDDSAVSTILDSEVQQRLLELGNRNPSLKIKGNSFHIKFLFIPDNEADFDQIIGLVKHIMEKF